jgi:multiple sugar transport system permease protein
MRIRASHQSIVAIYVGYALVLAAFIAPALWVFSLSLRPLDEMVIFPPALFPAHLDVTAYINVLTNSPLMLYIWNTLEFAAATVIGALGVALPSAYACSRLQFGSSMRRQGVMLLILGVQLISPLVIMLPLYRYCSALGLINSQLAVALVYIAVQSPFATWMLKGFLDTVPTALDDTARIDGCSRLQTLFHVLIPVMLPGLSATAILLLINTWGQFLIPYVLLDKAELLPIGVGILDFQSTTDAVSTNQLAAAAVLTALPALVIVVVLQRYIIEALTMGAVKG